MGTLRIQHEHCLDLHKGTLEAVALKHGLQQPLAIGQRVERRLRQHDPRLAGVHAEHLTKSVVPDCVPARCRRLEEHNRVQRQSDCAELLSTTQPSAPKTCRRGVKEPRHLRARTVVHVLPVSYHACAKRIYFTM